jgi:hypothetical protein
MEAQTLPPLGHFDLDLLQLVYEHVELRGHRHVPLGKSSIQGVTEPPEMQPRRTTGTTKIPAQCPLQAVNPRKNS